MQHHSKMQFINTVFVSQSPENKEESEENAQKRLEIIFVTTLGILDGLYP